MSVYKLAKSLTQKKYRQETGLFLIEGKKLVKEAINKSVEILEIFSDDEKLLDEIKKENPQKNKVQFLKFKAREMQAISSTSSPVPIAAIAKQGSWTVQGYSNLELYCEGISDPGNLGSIIRTALAASVERIFLSENSIDIYNPKLLRSSAGAVFAVDISVKSLDEINTKNHFLIGTSSYAEKNYKELVVPSGQKTILLLGSEAKGLSEKAISSCDELVKIPINPKVESLNVLAAASLLLFHLTSFTDS
jgi:RNA methyltransferase, TrmH family